MLSEFQFGVDFHVDTRSVQRLEQRVTELAEQVSRVMSKLTAAAETASRANAQATRGNSQGWPVLRDLADALSGDNGHVEWLWRASGELQRTAAHIRVQRLNYQEGDNDITARMNAVAEQLGEEAR